MENISFFEIIWIFIIISTLIPIIKQKRLEAMRYRKIRAIEQERKSRLIALIHRQEMLGFLGFTFFRYISIEDAENILNAIRLTPDDVPIDIILHTPGGLVLPTEQIAFALKKHPAKVTVMIPHYAMSGGTFIALAADEILLDENAVLGPVDPQVGEFPAASILKVLEKKKTDKIDDKTLMLADIAEKALRQVNEMLFNLLKDGKKLTKAKARKVADILTGGKWTHDYPITLEEAEKFGLPVTSKVPKEIYELMKLYPQPPQRRPTVEYIPIPYKSDKKERKPKEKPESR